MARRGGPTWRALKTIAEHGPENVNVLLQGNLKPATATGGPYELDAAGLTVTPKVSMDPNPYEVAEPELLRGLDSD